MTERQTKQSTVTYSHTHAYTHTYSHTHAYTYTHTHAPTHTHTYIYTHTYTHAHTCTRTYTHTHTCVAATSGSPLRGVTRLCVMHINSSASAFASSVWGKCIFISSPSNYYKKRIREQVRKKEIMKERKIECKKERRSK